MGLEEVKARYGSVAKDGRPGRERDVLCQVRKLADCMARGYTSREKGDDPDDPTATAMPSMFKKAVAEGSEDFCTGQQQDAAEYFRWLVNKISAHEVDSEVKLGGLFGFELEGKKTCVPDGKVRYASDLANVLNLPVPKDRIKWEEEEEQDPKKMKVEGQDEKKKPKGSLSLYECLDSFCAETDVPDYTWSHLGGKAAAKSTQGFKSFPKYLALAVGRYEIGPDWQPKKVSGERRA